MTEQEILEGNKLIAEFMGMTKTAVYWHFPEGFNIRGAGRWEDKKQIAEYLYFNESYDWLLPVLNKIKSGRLDGFCFGSIHVHISATGFQAAWGCSILGTLTRQKSKYDGKGNYDEYEEIHIPHISKTSTTNDSPIYSCYLSVIEFIEWYNNSFK